MCENNFVTSNRRKCLQWVFANHDGKHFLDSYNFL